MPRAKHIVEYACLRAISFWVNLLPYRAALVIGWMMAWVGYHVFGYRVRNAQSRIRDIFGPDIDERKIRRIAWQSWRNFVFMVIDIIRIPSMTPEWIRSHVIDCETVGAIQEHLKTGQGAIIATAHMGSWEMAALACSVFRIPLFSIAARQKNELVDNYFNQLRSKTGFEIVFRSSSILKGIIDRIRGGKVLAILPDVRHRTQGLTVRLLGREANIGGGLGLIARHTGVPVFPCILTRVGWTRHRYRVFPPILPDASLDKRSDWKRITQKVFDVFDRCIREEPEQWFWYNKRWLFDPLTSEEESRPPPAGEV